MSEFADSEPQQSPESQQGADLRLGMEQQAGDSEHSADGGKLQPAGESELSIADGYGKKQPVADEGRKDTVRKVPPVADEQSGRSGGGNGGSSGAPVQPAPPAPEEYRIDYGQPGGVDPYIDREFRDFAHRNGISGELAQKLVDFSNSLELGRMRDHLNRTSQWEREVRSLPGWHGRNYDHNMSVARRAMQAFGSPELTELIRTSGYGNHPEVVKAFYNVGKSLSEDSYVDSSRRTPRKKTIGEILYPNQPI
ncbi:hypothetical protein [Maridesulfovibrio sp. FT414]|uniref:hypothetical protein n=1 Tax=Maridesulfovibrio sp. FT414 TaxID=2979469 RepID=UPI003D8047C0